MEYHRHYKGCHIEKYLLKMPSNRIWIDYNKDADALYNNFNMSAKTITYMNLNASNFKDFNLYKPKTKD